MPFLICSRIVDPANQQRQNRSKAAVVLTDFGHPPGNLDLVVYLSEMKGHIDAGC